MKKEAIEDDKDSNDQRGWSSIKEDILSKISTLIKIEPDIPDPEPSKESVILDPEHSMEKGIFGAFKYAMNSGYLDKVEDENQPVSKFSKFEYIKAQNYCVENKSYELDDKFDRRATSNGPIREFKEKIGYKPNVKLEYFEDDGNKLSTKEAFKHMCYKFYGTGPGKNKIEKRMKTKNMELR